jgi:phosphotransferase family enzyme
MTVAHPVLGPDDVLGGPFDTAASFLEAWADSAKFKRDNETITRMMQRGPISAEEIINIVNEVPSQIKAIAGQFPFRNEGPFPLCHNDFFHSNIMVDETNLNVTGIIDWEGACTVPWAPIAYPDFYQALPRSFDLPEKYDQDGQPCTEDVKQRWRERHDYCDMVKAAEDEDTLLSASLENTLNQTLAYTYGVYTNGKLGFFNAVSEELKVGAQL